MGPLLGPLSIARCSVLGEAGLDDDALKQLFLDAQIPVADSKKIHQSGKIARLESVALGAIAWFTGSSCQNAAELFSLLGESAAFRAACPWMAGAEELSLPLAAKEIPSWDIPGLKPAGLSGSLLHPEHINDSYDAGINKLTLELDTILLLIKDAPATHDAYVSAVDRLGGRAYYSDALNAVFADSCSITLEEKATSAYRYQHGFAPGAIAFLVKGEDRNPLIASASCVAKYARELHMHLLNSYWTQRLNWLKQTAGYPQDAKRWLFQLGEGTVASYQHQLVRGNYQKLMDVH